jgi:hypothetical protein
LGLFKDNIEVLLSAINYLKSYKNSWHHHINMIQYLQQ